MSCSTLAVNLTSATDKMKKITSPLTVFLVIIISVLVVETLLMIMLSMSGAETMTGAQHKFYILLDGLLLCLFLSPLLLKFVYWPMKKSVEQIDKAKLEREKTIHELKKALAEVKQLRGIIPICASCKNIRNDEGLWQQVEAYIEEHSDADFSHSMCPDCAARVYEKLKQLEKKE